MDPTPDVVDSQTVLAQFLAEMQPLHFRQIPGFEMRENIFNGRKIPLPATTAGQIRGIRDQLRGTQIRRMFFDFTGTVPLNGNTGDDTTGSDSGGGTGPGLGGGTDGGPGSGPGGGGPGDGSGATSCCGEVTGGDSYRNIDAGGNLYGFDDPPSSEFCEDDTGAVDPGNTACCAYSIVCVDDPETGTTVSLCGCIGIFTSNAPDPGFYQENQCCFTLTAPDGTETRCLDAAKNGSGVACSSDVDEPS